jgi:hypothetical protein
MSDVVPTPATLREAMGLAPEGFLDRVSEKACPRGERVNRARRILSKGPQPTDDELATVLVGWLLKDEG